MGSVRPHVQVELATRSDCEFSNLLCGNWIGIWRVAQRQVGTLSVEALLLSLLPGDCGFFIMADLNHMRALCATQDWPQEGTAGRRFFVRRGRAADGHSPERASADSRCVPSFKPHSTLNPRLMHLCMGRLNGIAGA